MINKRFAVILILVLSLASIISAQYKKGGEYDPYDKNFFLTARGGVLISQDMYSFRKDTVLQNLAAYFESDMTTPPNFIYGGGFGFFITDNIGIRVDIDAFSADYECNFTLGITNPFNTSTYLTASSKITGISSNWTLLSADLIFRQKFGSSFVIMAGGGVTYCVADIYAPSDFSWSYSGLTPVLVGVDFDVYDADVAAFNVIATLEVYIDDDIALSVEGKYFKAEKEIDVPTYISSSPINATLGGIALSAGIMMHF